MSLLVLCIFRVEIISTYLRLGNGLYSQLPLPVIQFALEYILLCVYWRGIGGASETRVFPATEVVQLLHCCKAPGSDETCPETLQAQGVEGHISSTLC